MVKALTLYLGLIAAPIPTGTDPLDCIKPGFQWRFGWYVLQVERVDGEQVTYTCISDPTASWADNIQTRAQCLDESRKYGVPQPGEW
jgi:hypothetical protein